MPGDPRQAISFRLLEALNVLNIGVADFGLHLPGGPRAGAHPVDSFRPHQPPPQAAHSRGEFSRLKSVLLCGVGPCTADPTQWSQPVLAVNWPGGKLLPLMYQ